MVGMNCFVGTLSLTACGKAQARQLIWSVQPFDARMFKSHLSIAPGARRGLEVLETCARQLLQEVRLEGYALGMDVQVQVRVQSRTPHHKSAVQRPASVCALVPRQSEGDDM